jgi:hypothetical protein
MIAIVRMALCSSVLLLCRVPGDSQVIRDEEIGPARERVIVVAPKAFTEQSVRSWSSGLLREAHVPLAKLIIATSEEDARSMEVGKATHLAYQGWYPSYVEQRRSSGPVAELITLGRKATLRIYWPPGKTSESVLGTGDALSFRTDNATFELLDFYVRRLASPVEGVAPDAQLFDLYFRGKVSDRSSLDAAAALTERLLLELGVRAGVTAYIRDDTWFIDEPTFPVFYRFSGDQPVPSREEYYGRRQITCVIDHHLKVSCSGHNLGH